VCCRGRGRSFLLSGTADFGAQAGQWLLTVAVAFAVTGALSLVVRQIDQRRSEREAWHAVLHDLVVANQKVEMARLRLLAHRSARSYQEQFGPSPDQPRALTQVSWPGDARTLKFKVLPFGDAGALVWSVS